MKIVNFRNRGLQRFYERNDASKLDQRWIAKLRVQLTVLDDLAHSDQLRRLGVWKVHQLSDDRWSFHLTANWRMTFLVDDTASEISILDLEDYH